MCFECLFFFVCVPREKVGGVSSFSCNFFFTSISISQSIFYSDFYPLISLVLLCKEFVNFSLGLELVVSHFHFFFFFFLPFMINVEITLPFLTPFSFRFVYRLSLFFFLFLSFTFRTGRRWRLWWKLVTLLCSLDKQGRYVFSIVPCILLFFLLISDGWGHYLIYIYIYIYSVCVQFFFFFQSVFYTLLTIMYMDIIIIFSLLFYLVRPPKRSRIHKKEKTSYVFSFIRCVSPSRIYWVEEGGGGRKKKKKKKKKEGAGEWEDAAGLPLDYRFTRLGPFPSPSLSTKRKQKKTHHFHPLPPPPTPPPLQASLFIILIIINQHFIQPDRGRDQLDSPTMPTLAMYFHETPRLPRFPIVFFTQGIDVYETLVEGVLGPTFHKLWVIDFWQGNAFRSAFDCAKDVVCSRVLTFYIYIYVRVLGQKKTGWVGLK